MRGIVWCVAGLTGLLDAQQPAVDPAARPHLGRALEVAKWLQSCARDSPHGLRWPADPQQPDRCPVALSSGSAGVVLFFAELAAATDSEVFGAVVRRGAEHLVASLPAAGEPVDAGLYTGVAGLAFTLWVAHRVTGEARFAAAARDALGAVQRAAQRDGEGAHWNDVHDVIGGAAGTGLFLLWAARELEDPDSLALARRVGHWLDARGIAADSGRRWAMRVRVAREYPNFSHGTAGIGLFFAELYRATGDSGFLETARAAGDYLAATSAEGLVPHHLPGGEALHYLGWCHGPPGTTRLYRALAGLTADPVWRAAEDAAFTALVRSGIPERRPPGFWNNAGQCCGTAGVVEWLLELDDGPAQRALLARSIADLSARATVDEAGARWVHAEHRARPDAVAAQTGYMQGAAGIGLCWLHLDGRGRRSPTVVLPDQPRRAGAPPAAVDRQPGDSRR